MRDAFLYAPTLAVFILIGGARLILGGWYSALLALMFFVFGALSGWWDRAMITAYMVLFAVFVCLVHGAFGGPPDHQVGTGTQKTARAGVKVRRSVSQTIRPNSASRSEPRCRATPDRRTALKLQFDPHRLVV